MKKYVKASYNNEIINIWLENLYTDALEEAKANIENERIWGYGSDDDMSDSNIENLEEYIEVLEELIAELQ